MRIWTIRKTTDNVHTSTTIDNAFDDQVIPMNKKSMRKYGITLDDIALSFSKPHLDAHS
ncbi:hypothetical protein LT85_4563 [Collimonas arenae]|uniref:Uncharacterized protein n=1 Tax=Collimonas arenae TaxID=279058 RepID=A0A0A1FGM7_9BURK|nr:hypothetical protein LT85_4563 [Collimonas arenae]